MGNCKYCRENAGWFTNAHEECQKKHQTGTEEMLALATHCARTGHGLDTAKGRLAEIARLHYVHEGWIKTALIGGWERALDQVLQDGILSQEEESGLMAFANQFNLSKQDLDGNSAFTRAQRCTVLREVMQGNIPAFATDRSLPFNLQKSETLVWVFENVPYYEQKVRRHFEGRSQGVSIRIMKGVYYRVGAFKGYPVETTELVHMDTGLLGVSSKHLYFSGSGKSLRIPYQKIVTFTPYEDGIGICRDTASAKPQSFKTGDGWFTYNLAVNLSKQG
jgi:hypothetical protein